MKGVEGQVALVTGASRGIGKAVAHALIERGATVHVLAEDAGIEACARDLSATAHCVDITDEKGVERALQSIDHIDILINNAGLERLTPLSDTSAESLAVFRRIIDINLVGTTLVTAQALLRMQEGGRIINTASVWGRVAEPLFGAYVASKHGVIGLTKTWSKELGERGIRVNAVAPGWVRTEASVRSARHLAVRQGVSEGALIDAIAAGQALPGGLMEPEDVVGAYLYLASDLSRNITGQTIGIDRGEAPW